MMNDLIVSFILIKDEIKNTNHIDRLEAEIPRSALCLLLHRKGGIKN